jgi:anti-anti-sigma regulatory factor
MEIRKGIAGKDLLWKVGGRLDDESFLEFETMVLNSGYKGEDLILDLSDVCLISDSGKRSVDRVVRTAEEKGARVTVLSPEGFFHKKNC